MDTKNKNLLKRNTFVFGVEVRNELWVGADADKRVLKLIAYLKSVNKRNRVIKKDMTKKETVLVELSELNNVRSVYSFNGYLARILISSLLS